MFLYRKGEKFPKGFNVISTFFYNKNTKEGKYKNG